MLKFILLTISVFMISCYTIPENNSVNDSDIIKKFDGTWQSDEYSSISPNTRMIDVLTIDNSDFLLQYKLIEHDNWVYFQHKGNITFNQSVVTLSIKETKNGDDLWKSDSYTIKVVFKLSDNELTIMWEDSVWNGGNYNNVKNQTGQKNTVMKRIE